MELIKKGERYSDLKRSYVIFICTFDLFGKGLYRYTFEHRCIENHEVRLDDGAQRIFLNTKGILEETISENMRAFLEYVEGKQSENVFVQKIENEVEAVKNNEELRGDYMNQVVRDNLCREEGRAEGIIATMRAMKATDTQVIEFLMLQMEITEEQAREYLKS